jgi:hypothetical protein
MVWLLSVWSYLAPFSILPQRTSYLPRFDADDLLCYEYWLYLNGCLCVGNILSAKRLPLNLLRRQGKRNTCCSIFFQKIADILKVETAPSQINMMVSVLFADIVNFTPMSALMTPLASGAVE